MAIRKTPTIVATRRQAPTLRRVMPVRWGTTMGGESVRITAPAYRRPRESSVGNRESRVGPAPRDSRCSILVLTGLRRLAHHERMSVPPRSRNGDVARLLEEIGDLLEIK